MSAVERTRVVITGLGAVTPVGNTAEEFWASLTQGKSGIGPITRFDSEGFPTRIAGEVKGFDALKYVDKKDERKLDLYLKYAVACAVMAVEDAGLDPAKEDGDRFGVLVGSGIGGISTLLESHKVLLDKGPDRVSPFFIPMERRARRHRAQGDGRRGAARLRGGPDLPLAAVPSRALPDPQPHRGAPGLPA